jgi:hypothetical protein
VRSSKPQDLSTERGVHAISESESHLMKTNITFDGAGLKIAGHLYPRLWHLRSLASGRGRWPWQQR